MANSDHEEADTRIVLHVHDSLERGSRKIMIRTVDTDVIVILIGHFYSIVDHYPDADLWVAFGTGKHFRYYHLNTICGCLGRKQSRCLPPFHAFTGCDSTSSFYGKTKKKQHGLPGAFIQRSLKLLSSCLRTLLLKQIVHHIFFFCWKDSQFCYMKKPAALNQLMKHIRIYFARKLEV